MKKFLFAALAVLPLSLHAEDVVTIDTPVDLGTVPMLTSVAPAAKNGRELVTAFYELLSNTNNGDDANLADRAAEVVSTHWKADPVPFGGPGLQGLVNTFGAYHQAVPDIKWTPQEILKAGSNRYIVRSIGTGTPAVDFLHIGDAFKPGNSFNIMTIDIHTVKNGKIVKTYHVEDWKSALSQLTAAQ